MERPGTIEVTEEWVGDVAASAARVKLSIEGERLFTGDAALEQARELVKLREALESAAIPREDVRVAGVRAHVSSGLLGRHTSATYLVHVHCREIAELPAVLEVATGQKKVELTEIDWEYPTVTQKVAGWIALCVKNAAIKAEAIAEALDVDLGVVLSAAEETFAQPEGASQARDIAVYDTDVRRRASLKEELASTEFAPLRRVGVRVRLTYSLRPRL
jgi:uncharacterized protein YggE